MITCTRCGECCREAKICDIRKWILGDAHIPESGCELLKILDDGSTSCIGIEKAFNPNDVEWYEPTRQWIMNTLTTRGCERKLWTSLR